MVPFDTVSAKGIDPLVQLGTLEAMLTGRGYEQIVAGPRAGHVLTTQDGGERLVVTLTDELQDVLADAQDGHLADVVVPWSQTEEFSARVTPRHSPGCSTNWLSLHAGPARRMNACTAGSASSRLDHAARW